MQETNQKVIMVKEEVVADIQAKDVAAQTAADVISKLLNQHQLDTDTTFVKSPIFMAYQEEAAAKRVEWEKAKDKMVLEYIPADLQAKAKDWTLNYGTNELTITF